MATPDEAVLRRMRASRRKRRGAQRDWIDASYELWLRAFFAIVVVVVVPIILSGDELDAHAITQFRHHAPGVVSVFVAVAIWVALRAGAGGAPLAPERPDVMYLLLSPLPRATVLRPLARSQLRTAVGAGLIVGVASGLAAAARLPEGPGAWALGGLVAGPCLAALLWGTVAAASARRITARIANGIGVLVLAGAIVDATFHTWITPSTWISSLLLLPLHGLVPPVVVGAGIALAVVVPIAALVMIGGTALEPLLQRSALVSQMRYAASTQDMRTAVLLHRQLAMEGSRNRPWIRLPRRETVRRPVWRRGWHGYARWPADRVLRVFVLVGVAAGLAYAARSTHLLIIAAGVALFVAALDVLEPFAAELDHPTLLLTYGVSIRAILLRNLAAPVALFVGIGLAAAAAVAGFAGAHVGLVFATAVSGALAALAGSALNVVLGPPPASALVLSTLYPEYYGLMLLVRQGLPPAIAVAGLSPIVVAAAVGDGSAIAVAINVCILSVTALLYSALRGV